MCFPCWKNEGALTVKKSNGKLSYCTLTEEGGLLSEGWKDKECCQEDTVESLAIRGYCLEDKNFEILCHSSKNGGCL